MQFKLRILCAFWLLITIVSGCSTKWTEAIQRENLSHDKFREIVGIEIDNNLIIVRVAILGKIYRFWFDTGAHFCVYHQIQNEVDFNIMSKGKIVHSDHKRRKVDWVKVDLMNIGTILFKNQTAFVGDFSANPILEFLVQMASLAPI